MVKTLKILLFYILIIIMVIMLFCVFMQFLLRYGFNTSYQVLEEVSNFSLTWITFLGAAAIFFEEKHIKIRFIRKLVSGNLQKGLALIAEILITFFLGVFTIKSAQLAYLVRFQSSVFLQVPMVYMYMSMPISGLLMMIYQVKKLKTWAGSPGEDTQESS
ncbi:MAG: TRAP transporter small permease [Halanaerobiales bacterium]|nr:TRAP transporter small permease [Halanaerobiales bacterium]